MGLFLLTHKLTRLCGGTFKELDIKGDLKIVFLCCVTAHLRFIDHIRLETHTQPVGHPCTSDHLVAEVTTYTTHKEHTRRTSIPLARFEPAIPPP